MATFNKVFEIGNLVRNPELRHTSAGVASCEFRIAVGRRFRTANGEEKEETLFIDVLNFGKAAELYVRHLEKGSRVMVEGYLKQLQWTGKNGEKREKIAIMSENVQFLAGANSNGRDGRDGRDGQSGNQWGDAREPGPVDGDAGDGMDF